MTVRGPAWDAHETLALTPVLPARAGVSIPTSVPAGTKPVCHVAENASSNAQEHNRAGKRANGHRFLFGRGSKVFLFREPQLSHSSWSRTRLITSSDTGEGIALDLGMAAADRQRAIRAHECPPTHRERNI